jgi:hypothetical protein
MLIYIDESGKPHANDPHDYAVLGAITIHPCHQREFCNQVFNYKKRYWGVDDPVGERFELKGRLLLNRKGVQNSKNIKLVRNILKLCKRYRVTTFASIHPRPSPQNQEVMTVEYITRWYIVLLESINDFMLEMEPEHRAMIVFDEYTREHDALRARAFSNFLFRSDTGKRLGCIGDTAFFADSTVTPGLEVVDIITYCIGRHYCGNRPDIPAQFYQQIEAMQFQSTFHPSHVGFREVHLP